MTDWVWVWVAGMSLTMLYLGIPPAMLLTMPLLQFVKLLPSLLPVGLDSVSWLNGIRVQVSLLQPSPYLYPWQVLAGLMGLDSGSRLIKKKSWPLVPGTVKFQLVITEKKISLGPNDCQLLEFYFIPLILEIFFIPFDWIDSQNFQGLY